MYIYASVCTPGAGFEDCGLDLRGANDASPLLKCCNCCCTNKFPLDPPPSIAGIHWAYKKFPPPPPPSLPAPPPSSHLRSGLLMWEERGGASMSLSGRACQRFARVGSAMELVAWGWFWKPLGAVTCCSCCRFRLEPLMVSVL